MGKRKTGKKKKYFDNKMQTFLSPFFIHTMTITILYYIAIAGQLK